MDAAMAVSQGIVATCQGIRVPAAPHFGARMIAAMAAGTYEQHEVQLALAHVPKGARILELGAGSGLAGAIVARHCQPEAMLSIEANPNLLPHIRALYRENGLEGVIDVQHGVVLSAPDAPDAVDFYLRGNFLGSGLNPTDKDRITPVSVPVLRYAELCARHPHDVILMDIEGAERDFLRHADLSAVRLLIGEFHRGIYGREGMRECRKLLAAQGLVMDEKASLGGVHVWTRP